MHGEYASPHSSRGRLHKLGRVTVRTRYIGEFMTATSGRSHCSLRPGLGSAACSEPDPQHNLCFHLSECRSFASRCRNLLTAP